MLRNYSVLMVILHGLCGLYLVFYFYLHVMSCSSYKNIIIAVIV